MNNYHKAAIFLNGGIKKPSYAKIFLDESTLLIGADGGADGIYALGLKPHAIIGDFDSLANIPKKLLNIKPKKTGSLLTVDNTIYYKFPAEKDYLDCQLALDYALKRGAVEILFFNCSSDELDLSLGVFFVVGKTKYRFLNIKIIQPNFQAFVIEGDAVISGHIGQPISLIPLYGPVKVKNSSGLKYDPSKYQMKLTANSGISNLLTKPQARLRISSGKFLVIKRGSS